MSKPTLVLVHGSWHCHAHFGPLVKELQSHGYNCMAINLPSTQSPELPPATLKDDIAAVRSGVTQAFASDDNVVVVAHSYGGHVTNRALKGFDSKSRATGGASTAVVEMAFICAIPTPPGPSFLDALGGKPAPIHDLRNEFFCWVGEPGPEHYFYNDLEEQEAKRWSALLKPQSWVACCEASPDAAYTDIPSAYLYCKQDNAFPYDLQKGLVEAAIAAGAKINHTETVDSSHSPFLSMPQRTAEFIRRVAGEKIELSE